MKKVRFIVCAVMALVLFSCEKAPMETRYQLPPYSAIPDYVQTVKENQLSGSPDNGLLKIFMVENKKGLFYELCFGDVWGYFTSTIEVR